jgi:hypothetical protein
MGLQGSCAERTGTLMLLVDYPVCPHPLHLFHLFFFYDCIAESCWESRLVLAVLEDDRVTHPSQHDKVKGAGSRICLGTECKDILKSHILPAQKHQKHPRPFIFSLIRN